MLPWVPFPFPDLSDIAAQLLLRPHARLFEHQFPGDAVLGLFRAPLQLEIAAGAITPEHGQPRLHVVAHVLFHAQKAFNEVDGGCTQLRSPLPDLLHWQVLPRRPRPLLHGAASPLARREYVSGHLQPVGLPRGSVQVQAVCREGPLGLPRPAARAAGTEERRSGDLG